MRRAGVGRSRFANAAASPSHDRRSRPLDLPCRIRRMPTERSVLRTRGIVARGDDVVPPLEGARPTRHRARGTIAGSAPDRAGHEAPPSPRLTETSASATATLRLVGPRSLGRCPRSLRWRGPASPAHRRTGRSVARGSAVLDDPRCGHFSVGFGVERRRGVSRLPITRTIARPGPARPTGERNRAIAVHVRLDPAASRFAPGGTRRGSNGGACKRARQAHARDPFTSPEFDRFGAAESPATPSSQRAAARVRTVHTRHASRAALGVFGRAAASPVERLFAIPLRTPPRAPSPPPPGRDSGRSRSCRARGRARASRSCRSSP